MSGARQGRRAYVRAVLPRQGILKMVEWRVRPRAKLAFAMTRARSAVPRQAQLFVQTSLRVSLVET
jgi:hypothetical protein